MHDSYDLQRFVSAQSKVYAEVVQELKEGRKRSHWMWFVFPQASGLGHSETARHYAISSRKEAQAYLAHPVLGHRLREATLIVLGLEGTTPHEVFGHPDDLKFHSCMTLFALVTGPDDVFQQALDQYFDGYPDDETEL